MCLICQSCAPIEKSQYYMAVEPDTGQRAIYKLTLRITGYGAERYKLTSGYVDANVVDALSGNLKEPSDLASPNAQASQRASDLQHIDQMYGERLRSLADTMPSVPLTQPAKDPIRNATNWYARLYYARSLADSDLTSVGQTNTDQPFSYRKLVFFVSTKTIPIGNFSNELDAVDQSTGDVIDAIQGIRSGAAASTEAKVALMSRAQSQLLDFVKGKPDLSKWTENDFLDYFATVKGVLP